MSNAILEFDATAAHELARKEAQMERLRPPDPTQFRRLAWYVALFAVALVVRFLH